MLQVRTQLRSSVTEPTRPDSAQESDTSIPEAPKRMFAVTITPMQLTIATALTSRSRPPRRVWSLDWLVAEEEEAVEEEAVEEEAEEEQPPCLSQQQPPPTETAN